MSDEAITAQRGAAPGRPSMLFLIGALAGGNVVSSALRMAGGLLQARCVLPEVLGLFGGLGLVLGYTRFLQLGILNGLNRELPYFFGKGDYEHVKELAAAAQAWAVALGALVALALLAVATWYLLRGEPWLAAGWATQAVLAFIFFYGAMYLQATYRTTHDFARLSLVNVLQNAVALLLVALVALLGFYGLCLRAVLSGLAGLALFYYWRPVHVGLQWSFGRLRHLLIIGLPIFGVGELTMFWTTLEATLVLDLLGKRDMGLYQMVVVAGTTLELLPMAVSQVIYPRMAQEYGQTGRLGGLLRMAVKPMLLTFVGMAPLAVLGWWLARPLTQLLLPNYLDAVPAMQWALLPPLLTSLFPIHNVYNVVRRQDLYTVATLLGMGSYFLSLAWRFQHGAVLSAFPQAMLIGRGVHLVACYLLLVLLRSRKRRSGARPLRRRQTAGGEAAP